ncbi:MAG: thiol peroxidase [Thermodesulfobacteriota bacterium]
MEAVPKVTLKGTPFSLAGPLPAPGQPAPDFVAVGNDLSPVRFSSAFKGKVVIIASVPSLDTPVCEIETKRFNKEAAALGHKVAIVTVSMDLPFAQKRWCAAAGVESLTTVSDHRDADFGTKYGVLIKDLRLLARAVFVVDDKGVVRYTELVPEVSHEPEYDSVLAAVKKLL